jgi:hypothetical protein
VLSFVVYNLQYDNKLYLVYKKRNKKKIPRVQTMVLLLYHRLDPFVHVGESSSIGGVGRPWPMIVVAAVVDGVCVVMVVAEIY